MSTIKVAFRPLYEALTELPSDTTIEAILATPTIMSLIEASRGGFTGENNFVEVDGLKVARICAITGAVFAHDNTDKAVSFFYKNGSYMIGAEIVKANSRKVWEAERELEEQELEDQMLEGVINPKEWKEQATALKSKVFEFHITDDRKAELIADYDGFDTKEAFIEAYTADEVNSFESYQDTTDALRAEGRPQTEEEA